VEVILKAYKVVTLNEIKAKDTKNIFSTIIATGKIMDKMLYSHHDL
jgi:hypothetical protein